MAAVPRPVASPAAALARLAREVGLFLLDLLLCLASMVLPTLSCAVALAVISLIAREMALRESPEFGGFICGALAMCVVACLLIWASVRHRWWSR